MKKNNEVSGHKALVPASAEALGRGTSGSAQRPSSGTWSACSRTRTLRSFPEIKRFLFGDNLKCEKEADTEMRSSSRSLMQVIEGSLNVPGL